MRFEFDGRVAARMAPRAAGLARTALVVALVALAGCHPFHRLASLGGTCHDVKPYMAAKSVTPLQIPPGLDAPDTGSSLKIPRLNEPEPRKRSEKEPCLDEPPAFATPKKPVPQARSIIRAPSGAAMPG